MRWLRSSLLAFAACTRAHEAPPAPAPTPAPAPAPAPGLALREDAGAPPVIQALAIDGPGPAAPETSGARFGVRWRVTLSGDTQIMHDASYTSTVIGDEVLTSRPGFGGDVFDRATGAKRRTIRDDLRWEFEAGGVLVAKTATEVVGLGKDRVTPIWRLPLSQAFMPLGAWILEEPDLRLRRPADGKIVWELGVRRDHSALSKEVLVGDTLYIQLEHNELAAIDIATGKIRWRKPGTLRDASAGHVVISPPSSYQAIQVLDPAGRARLHAEAVTYVLLHGDIAYVTTPAALTAIDLSTNTVKWRRAGANAYAVSDAWLYSWSDAEPMTVLARDTGALAGRVPIGRLQWPLRLTNDEPVVELGERWLLGLGALAAPEPTAIRDARGCLVVQGCSKGVPAVGSTVKLAGVTAKTDQRGCFSVRTRLGLAPVSVAVSGGKMAGMDLQLENPFPGAVVFDGPPLTLVGGYIGGGCHDSRPGTFP